MASSLDKLVGNLQKDQFVNIKEYLRKKNKAAIAEYNTAKDIVYRHIKELENPISNAIDIGEFDFLKYLIDEQNELKKLLANLESKYEAQSAQRFALLIHKGVYPYDNVDGLEKMAETQLPPGRKNSFQNEDYVHAQKVWKEFECKTMRDYHNLYLTSDVLLLADVFDTFRDTQPGIIHHQVWHGDAALKLTEVKLELISDPDMLLMIEKGIRGGGVSTIMTRYGKANNKYMGDEFDPKKDSTYL
ncbi:hypothetical protein MAR_012442 [Mya arenaria]|uniref:DNA-directed DNA polymerase n=1 Tax=Mya arenaria TaxID=6604 RepID=A0ABY7G0S2_MYAAR|nr:hypothetical protein MAR_012442 [Mya arenaria]